jgi:hypothetical protein
MTFPANLTYAVDGITDVMADHLNNLEAKVGIDGSEVSTSLDYLLKNPGSVDPGHVHSGYQVAGSYITALTGDVAALGPGSAAATIQAGAVSLSKMANLAANSIIGNNTADPASPLALSISQVKSLLAIGPADVGLGNVTNDAQVKLNGSYSNPAWLTALAGTKINGFTQGYIPFGGTSALATDSGLFWDNTNKRLGIGTMTPANSVHVYGDVNGVHQLTIENNNSGASARTRFLLKHNGNDKALWYTDGGSSYLASVGATTDFGFTSQRNFNFNASNSSSGVIDFRQGTTIVMRIDNPGNLGLGVTGFGTSATKVFGIASGIGPSSAPADMAQMWVADINGAAGYAGLHKRTETTNLTEVIPGVVIKATTGRSANPYEGLMEINQYDHGIYWYAGGAWRTIVTWP